MAIGLAAVTAALILIHNEAEKKAEFKTEQDAVAWLRNVAMPKLRRLKDEKRWGEAFELAEEARNRVPNDEDLLSVWHEVSSTWTVSTTPPGGRVALSFYDDSETPPLELGTTPVNRVAVAREIYRWRIEAPGCEPQEGCAGPGSVDLKLTLTKQNSGNGMVQVTMDAQGDDESIEHSLSNRRADFLLDRCEVTNRQYQAFVNAGGYEDSQYWREPIIEGGQELPWREAVRRFVDTTGKPGPSTWANGMFPKGQAEYPVGGVSWYEAAAFARYAGKSLPSFHDWKHAAGVRYADGITRNSNMGSTRPMSVGSSRGIGPFGTYDMAGNVREWCLNKANDHQRYALGGAWDDNPYMFALNLAEDALDRDPRNGFRCAVYPAPLPPTMAEAVVRIHREYGDGGEQPVPDDVFEAFRRAYDYERRQQPNVERSVAEGRDGIRHEVITLDAPYDGDRLILHVYLPCRVPPPYQTVVFFPGQGATLFKTYSHESTDVVHAETVVDTGRAVVFPVYSGTYERGGGTLPAALHAQSS